MQDKSKELNTTVELVNNKLNFTGYTEGNEPVSIDYTPPLGDNLGYTSLELLLLSLSTCIGSSVLTFLRKMNKTINGCQITANGIRRQEHPTAFTHINVVIRVTSPDVHENDMIRVINLSEETYCPVWAMLKGNVDINTTFVIIK
ncbi:MAG: OsmC family protein [Chloroflexota bacterium]|nr:OsmC family protein [Lentimicrobium sp.]